MSGLTASTQQNPPQYSNAWVEHISFDASLWKGRNEPHETDRARYWYQVVQDTNIYFEPEPNPVSRPAPATCPNQTKVTLVGFACDQGVRRNLGRVGAKKAPAAIRQAFAKLPLSAALQNKFSEEAYVSLLADAGDIACHDNNTLMADILEQAQAEYSQFVTNIINQGSLAIGLGGGHAIAYGSYLGLWHSLKCSHSTQYNPLPRIGIINFDAHLDIRNAPNGTSGTPFRQIAQYNQLNNQPFYYCAIGISKFSNTAALFDRAEQLGVHIISDDACKRLPWSTIEQQLNNYIANVDVIYLTIDMDGFAASIVPGVSAPAAKGLDVDFVERCIEHIFASGKVKMADIAEINPTYDIDGRSCKVAARLLALMIEHHLLLE